MELKKYIEVFLGRDSKYAYLGVSRGGEQYLFTGKGGFTGNDNMEPVLSDEGDLCYPRGIQMEKISPKIEGINSSLLINLKDYWSCNSENKQRMLNGDRLEHELVDFVVNDKLSEHYGKIGRCLRSESLKQEFEITINSGKRDAVTDIFFKKDLIEVKGNSVPMRKMTGNECLRDCLLNDKLLVQIDSKNGIRKVGNTLNETTSCFTSYKYQYIKMTDYKAVNVTTFTDFQRFGMLNEFPKVVDIKALQNG